MALEDIDEAGEEPTLDLEQAALDADAGTDPQDPRDEDLFDLPDTGAAAPELEASEAHAIMGRAVEDPPVAGTPGTPGHDPELDEDVFDFGAIFAGGDIVLEAGSDVVVAPDTISVVSQGPSDTLELPEEPAPLAPADPLPAPAESGPTALPEPSPEPSPEPVVAPAQAPAHPTEGRDRPFMVLAGVLLLANSALILFVWQANNSFRGTISEVTRSLAEGLASATAPAQAAPRVEPAPAPAPSAADAAQARDSRPSGLESHAEQAIVISRRLMSEGRFIDARTTLCDLLSNADLLSLDRELIAEAEFLIAETYERQGSALLMEESR